MNGIPSRVIPAKAGIQDNGTSLAPASSAEQALDPRFRGGDNAGKGENAVDGRLRGGIKI